MKTKNVLMLILTAFIWGTAFVAQSMTMMEQKNFIVVEGMLLNAQRRAEEILLDYNHPLDFYVEEAKGRVK